LQIIKIAGYNTPERWHQSGERKQKQIIKKIIKKVQEMKATVEQMEQALIEISFFVGGLTDEAIEYYYNKLIA